MVKRPANIVVGIDLHEQADAALTEAARLAKSAGATLHLVHVIDAETIAAAGRVGDDATWIRNALETEAHRQLKARAADVPDTLEVQTHVIVGSPAATLLDVCNDVDAQLLVLSRNSTSDPGRGTGGHALRCVRDATINVLLVHHEHRGAFRNVVACIDFSALSLAAAEHAASVADGDGASLCLLHVFRPPWDVVPFAAAGVTPTGDVQQEYADSVRARLDRLAMQLGRRYSALSITAHLEPAGSIGTSIVKAIETLQCDLAVIGSHSENALERFLLGSTAERVVRSAHCSVLAVKQHVQGAEGDRFCLLDRHGAVPRLSEP